MVAGPFDPMGGAYPPADSNCRESRATATEHLDRSFGHHIPISVPPSAAVTKTVGQLHHAPHFTPAIDAGRWDLPDDDDAFRGRRLYLDASFVSRIAHAVSSACAHNNNNNNNNSDEAGGGLPLTWLRRTYKYATVHKGLKVATCVCGCVRACACMCVHTIIIIIIIIGLGLA